VVDRCYEREALLHAGHIHSFAPALRFWEQFVVSADVLVEYRTFRRDAHRSYRQIAMLPWPLPGEETKRTSAT
jgi:hypothetical protein